MQSTIGFWGKDYKCDFFILGETFPQNIKMPSWPSATLTVTIKGTSASSKKPSKSQKKQTVPLS